jgi:peptidyl-prolyl cis-trans isomerase A (cyclophilin A)
MESQTSLEGLHRRLAGVERSNRRLRVGLMASALVLGAAMLAGAAWIQDEVKAGRFLLVGKGDQGRAELGFSSDGMPRLRLEDRDGYRRAEVALNANGRPIVGLYGKDSKLRARFSLETGDTPSVAFFDAAGSKYYETPIEKPKIEKKKEKVRVKIATTKGDIVVELDPERAPITVENFLKYVDDKFYDGTIFHRVISNFMIQGGGFTREMNPFPKETRPPIKLESRNKLKNKRGAIAMARTGVPDSATAQFFINVVDNPNLDYPSPDGHGYAVFGEVVEGMDVVDKIRKVPTTNQGGPYANAPVDVVEIKSIRRVVEE